MIWIEYDDGAPMKTPQGVDRSPECTPRDRPRGFYLMSRGRSVQLPVGFMRVSEMKKLEAVVNELR